MFNLTVPAQPAQQGNQPSQSNQSNQQQTEKQPTAGTSAQGDGSSAQQHGSTSIHHTIIEYPEGKEVLVNLMPGSTASGGSGKATVMRSGSETTINLDVSGLSGAAKSYNLYAIDSSGKVTMLGPVNLSGGAGTMAFKTPMNRFMLVLSPEANISTFGPDTAFALRSAVPEGFAVVPMESHDRPGRDTNSPVGERVKAATTSGTTPAYNVPMMGLPGFRRGTDTEMKINFSGALTGSRANVYIEPRKDGPTTIKMRFHELKDAPANQRLVVWAVGPDNTYHRLGQVVNTGQRNEAQIQTETDLKDFGLFITAEEVGEAPQPTGAILGTAVK